ncbi:phosphotransferase [Salinimonas marina]|uniref:Phosphotransferase n=1 Tax=Salinimonas marina TaxID=2785918 RepID=A0A7S9DVS8_9ALTE|nr:phosphotransferase [Salinimonas marina]QPG04873.1 phosphotransferase [Salinimonas marina]
MRIPEALTQALSLSNDATLTPLDGGAVNHIYKLEDKSRHLLVKWLGEDTFSGIDRKAQFHLQQQLAGCSIAPQPLWMSDDDHWWVEQFETRQPGVVTPALLGKVLAHIHQLPITGPYLNLPARLQHYFSLADLATDSELAMQASELIQRLKNHPDVAGDLVCGHNDLSAGHLLRLKPLMLIDWEYAGQVSRYFDIASCCAINQFESGQQQQLFQAYAQCSGIGLHHILEHVSFYQRVVGITEALWHAALKATSNAM